MSQDQQATVFVVDDDDALRDSLEALLESAGMSVRSYASAPEFLEDYDPREAGCLALDNRMPGMSGIDLLQRLRDLPADRLRVIMITGHGDIDTAVAAMKAGAVDFIEKPFADEDFIERVQEHLSAAEAKRRHDEGDDAIKARLDELTPRERDVFDQIVEGHPNKIIAYHLGISTRTVEVHRARVMQKMAARTLSQLVRMALRVGAVKD